MAHLRQGFKDVGTCAIALLAMVALLFLAMFFIRGMVWVSDKVLPWLAYASVIAMALCIVVFLPLSFFRATRGFSALCYYFASYAFGLTLWAYSCLVAFEFWGYIGLILGLVLFGAGVVPVASLASLLHGEWGTLGVLIAGVVLTFGTRSFALHLMSKTGDRTIEID